jgi:hypothetical protein
MSDRVDQLKQDFFRTESTFLYVAEDCFEFLTYIVLRWSVVHLFLQLLNFVDLGTEDEHILITHLLAYFYISSVKRADDKSAVHDKLHIACARSFSTCCRNLV